MTTMVKDRMLLISMTWNSSFDMLAFFLDYRKVVNTFTMDCEAQMKDYDIDDKEWELAEDLCDLLQVR